MNGLHIEIIEKKIARELIVSNHYSHKWSSCRYAIGLIRDEQVVGVAVYGFPVGRQTVKSISPILVNDEVLELTRLWVRDEEGKNTESWFLGRTFSWLRRNTGIKVLVSYSDPAHGHLGVIYQATNWLYQGNQTMLVKGYVHVVNGERLHPRSCVAKYGTIKESVLRGIDSNYHRIEMPHKHRYIYIIDKRSRRRILDSLKHPIREYPNI